MSLRTAFPEFDKPLIDYLMRVSDPVVIRAGEMLLRPGQYFRNTILILDGKVKIYTEGPKGEEFFLYYLEKGNACALSILCANRNEVSQVRAKSITNVKALMVPLEHMDVLAREYPKWFTFIMDTYHTRLQELLQIINQVAFHSLEENLEFYLKRQFSVAHTTSISITHQEIATDLNSSREVISRLLKKLENDNRIQVSRNVVTNIGL